MILIFEEYKNKEFLKQEILHFLKNNTDISSNLCVDTQTISFKLKIRNEYCFKLLKELAKDKKIKYLKPINSNNFNCADWIFIEF